MENKLELRAYSIVLYQLSPIQAAIQGLHATIEYGVKFGMDNSSLYFDWAKNWKTVIVLNGGSSVTLTEAINFLKDNNIDHCEFNEPDLYNQVTSVSFILDERIFDRKKYLDFEEDFDCNEELPSEREVRYEEWLELVGGEKNALLRNWVKNFRLA